MVRENKIILTHIVTSTKENDEWCHGKGVNLKLEKEFLKKMQHKQGT